MSNTKLADFVSKNGLLMNVETITGDTYFGVESTTLQSDVAIFFYDEPAKGNALISIPMHQIKKVAIYEKE